MSVNFATSEGQVTFEQQLQGKTGPVVLIAQITVAPQDAERLIDIWAVDAAIMKAQPGCVATQFHRGSLGASTFVNVTVWETTEALVDAYRSPEFQASTTRYPDSTVVHRYLLEKIAVPGICVA